MKYAPLPVSQASLQGMLVRGCLVPFFPTKQNSTLRQKKEEEKSVHFGSSLSNALWQEKSRWEHGETLAGWLWPVFIWGREE